MGSGSSNSHTYCVDDKTTGHVEGFAKSIFIKYEYPTLKVFCNTYGIHQHHLVVVFKSYLSHEEVFLIEFRVRTNDLKRKFLKHSRLSNEMADIFFPAVYTIPFKGIEDPTVNDEFTFPRFCILSYIFGMQQIPDLLLQYFALLRRNLKLKISAFFFYFNIENMLKTLTEELKRSTALKIVMRCLANESPDREIALRDVVKMGLKYPLLFYSLIRFRRLFMRFVFGDKFWQGRKALKLKMKMDDILAHFTIEDVTARFANEKTATQYTAIAILTDIAAGIIVDPDYDVNIAVVPYVTQLDERVCLLVKEKLGYKDAKELIEESGLPITFTPLFMYSYEQLEASAAAEREESEREAAEYSQMLSSLSKSRKSNDDSDEDSLEDDEEGEDEEGDNDDDRDDGDGEDEKENENNETEPPPSLSSSKSARGMLGAVGGSFRFLTRGMSSKNIPTDAAIDEPDNENDDDVDGDEGEDENKKHSNGDDEHAEDGEGGEKTPAPAMANSSNKAQSSRSLLSAIGGSFKRMTLSRRGSSGKDLTGNKSEEEGEEEEDSLQGEAIINSAGGSSKSRKGAAASAEKEDADNNSQDEKENDKEGGGGEGSVEEGNSAKQRDEHSGSTKSGKLSRQKSLGYDFSAVMKNLDASDGDTTDDEKSRKKRGKKSRGNQRGGDGYDDDDEYDDRDIVIDKTPVHSGIQVIHDAQYQRNFRYNVVSGRSSWAIDIRGPMGGVIKQMWSCER